MKPLPLFDLDAPWRDGAACLGLDGEPFFGKSPHAAKAICQQCFVIEDCLNYALTARIEFGIWGGLSPRERRRVRTKRRAA